VATLCVTGAAARFCEAGATAAACGATAAACAGAGEGNGVGGVTAFVALDDNRPRQPASATHATMQDADSA
jgi:hypothetical protein